jgi:hypothetical protein
MYLYSFFNFSARWGGGGWSPQSPSRFVPGKDPVPIVQEAGLAPGPSLTGAENLDPQGHSILGLLSRSQSLRKKCKSKVNKGKLAIVKNMTL